MLMLSRGLVVSMADLLEGVGFDVRVMATDATPLAGPRILDATATAAAVAALPEVEEVVTLRMGEATVDLKKRTAEVALIGADAAGRRPWTLVRGRDLSPVLLPMLKYSQIPAFEFQYCATFELQQLRWYENCLPVGETI